MDPIQSLISGADPVRREPAGPDAEAALRQALKEGPVFSDSRSAKVLNFDHRRRSRARLAGVLTLTAAAVTAGVLVTTNLGALVSAPSPAPAGTVAAPSPATATPTATPTAATTGTPSATQPPTPSAPGASASAPVLAAPTAWTTFTDATGQATFEHPVGWTLSEAPQTIQGGAYNVIEVKNAAGKTMSTLRLVYDSAGGPVCPEPKPFQTLDSVVVDIPQKADKLREFARGPSAFVFRIIQGDKVYGSLALADGDLAPKTATCGLYNGILGPDNVPLVHFGDTTWLTADGQHAPLTFDSVAAAKAYMQTQEYKDVKRMLISLALQPAKTQPAQTASSARFVSQDGNASFVLPEGWTAKDVPAGTPDYPASGVSVSDETGKTVAKFRHGTAGGLGGACTEAYTITELDSASSSLTPDWAVQRGVRFSYRVMDQTSVGKGFTYQLGLVDRSSGGTQSSCLMYTVVSGTPQGMLSFADRAVQEPAEPHFASMAEARAYMEAPEYQKLKAMIQSLEITS